MEVTFRLPGLIQLLQAERTMGAKTEGILTDHLLTVGGYVARDVQDRYLEYSVKGAYGVQAKVFTSGLWVVQTIRKSRNPLKQRRNFGPKMMRKAFLPALHDNEDRVKLAATLAVAEATNLYWERRAA